MDTKVARFVSLFLLLLGGSLLVSLEMMNGSVASAATPLGPDPSRPVSRDSLLSQFTDPSAEYGPMDCWWWEAAHFNHDKARWQLEELKKKGVAGTWYYPRWVYNEPLSADPPYWSEKWWELQDFSMEEHQKLGLVHWFSDWTSHQFHQNRVRQERAQVPEYEGRRLVIHQQISHLSESIQIDIPAEEEILDAAAYQIVGDHLDFASRQDLSNKVQNQRLNWKAPEAGWLVAVIATQPYDLDYLNKRVIDRWNESFLGEYQQRLSKYVGGTLAAYGPDELWLLLGNTLYSEVLKKKVQSTRGYDLTPHLIGLFHDIGPLTDRIRCDYYEAMSSLLEENFYKPTSQWLEKRGLKYTTIATWGRLDPLEHTYHYGDYFRYMRWFHVTGNEDPYRTPVGERRLIDSKLSSSIAHLYGRPRTAVCAYWRSGWGVTQEENLAWTNENFAYGINLYNRHGGLHTLMGGWYEWVPPAIHFYQPYWRYWKSFTDYVRRLSYIMSQGKHRADVALLYPLTTMHANWVAGRLSGPLTHDNLWPAFEPIADESAQSLMKLAKALYHDGLDLDFINHSSIEQAEVQQDRLHVAGLEFRAVVLPPITTIRTATLKKIKTFFDHGGTVVAFGLLPGASAEMGRNDPTIKSLVQEMFGVAPGQLVTDVVGRKNERGGKAYFVPSNTKRVPDIVSQSITRDVVASETGVFHTHQKIGPVDVYFIFNTHAEQRKISFRLRVEGEPEIWDAFSGTVRPVHRFQIGSGYTDVDLTLDPYEGTVLALNPRGTRPAVVEDNLSSLVKVQPAGNQIQLQGFAAEGGRKMVRVAYQGREYVADQKISPSPATIALEGPFAFQLEPTMNNRWGDFRYPASNRMIGAEARHFRYREETDVDPKKSGWHQPNFDDSDWPEVTYSYGPYWWHIGPFQERANGSEAHLGRLERAKQGMLDLQKPWGRGEIGLPALRWKPYSFSQKFGHYGEVHHSAGGLAGVSENFFVFENTNLSSSPTHFLFTYVHSPIDGEYTLHFGGKPEKSDYHDTPGFEIPRRRQAWVNGKQVLSVTQGQDIWNVADLQKRGFQFDLGAASNGSTKPAPEEVRTQVHLKQGWNTVLLKIVQPEGKKVATYATFTSSKTPPASDPYVPRLRWFREPQQLIYDIAPHQKKRVGWYRFQAPPGLESLGFQANSDRTKAWINGKSVPVRAGQIDLSSPIAKTSQVALRVEQQPGSYAGAAFPDPISFECQEGQIALGDWSDSGLRTYSGVGVYSKEVRLGHRHLQGQVLLELGDARTVAEVFVNGKRAGIRMSRPFRFDISDFVQPGNNQIQIKVANTLANHMSSYPTHWVLEDQAVSGLLGPVQLRFHSKVKLSATVVQ